MSLTVTKLSGSTGDTVWSQSTNVVTPLPSGDGRAPAIRLKHGEHELFALIPQEGGNVFFCAINPTTGQLNRSAGVYDANASTRGTAYPATAAITTYFDSTYADIDVTASHVCFATPRVWAGDRADGGDIWALPRDVIYPVTINSNFFITLETPSWSINSMARTNTHALTIITDTVNQPGVSVYSAVSETLTHDVLYSLPPITAQVTPSLDVVNIAKVGQLIIGDISSSPALTGSPGDKRGMIRVANNGIYCCSADYVGDGSIIWSFAKYSNPNAPSYKVGPIGYDADSGRRIGIPGDVTGDIRAVMGANSTRTLMVCTDMYDGVTEIWQPSTAIHLSAGLTYTPSQGYESTTLAGYPSGYIVTQFYWIVSSTTSSIPADVSGGCNGRPAANANILSFIVPRPMTMQADRAHTMCRCLTAPTTTQILKINLNGAFQGAMRLDPGSTVGTIWQSWWFDLNAGDVLTVQAPATQDATVADIFFTLPGTTR